MNSPRLVSQINAELRPLLGDDQIVSGAQVLAVPSRRVLNQLSKGVYVASAAALIFVYFWANGHWHTGPALIGFAVAEAAAIALGLARIFVQRPMILAVTRRQLVCCRLPGPGKQPTGATAPLSRTKITIYRHSPRTTTVRCLMPGARPLRLNSVKGHQEDLERVVAVAHSSGARVHTVRDRRAGAPEEPRRSPGTPRNAPQSQTGRHSGFGPVDHLGTDTDAASRTQHRREYPGEHRRSERGGGEPRRS